MMCKCRPLLLRGQSCSETGRAGLCALSGFTPLGAGVWGPSTQRHREKPNLLHCRLLLSREQSCLETGRAGRRALSGFTPLGAGKLGLERSGGRHTHTERENLVSYA